MKPSPASLRTIDILNFMSVNPRRAFSMSELAAALGINHASTSQILLALTQSGYLARHPRHKTFELGPALVAIGHSASERHPVVELARPSMDALAALGTECVGSAVVGDDVIVLAIAGSPSRYAWEVRIGQRVPFLAPYASVYPAWGDRAMRERWVAGLGSSNPVVAARLENSLTVARTRGFVVGLYSDVHREVSELYARLGEHPNDESLWNTLRETIPQDGAGFILDDIEDGEEYTVSSVSAPVFGVDGSVVYALAVQGVGPIDGEALRRIGAAVSDTCRGLTRQLGGHPPDPGFNGA